MIANLSARDTPNQNHLLAALPAEIFERISPHLALTTMRVGDVLYEPGDRLQHVYFPTTAIVSLQYVMGNGATAKIAGVGNEGVLGSSLFLGFNSTPCRATVQTAGCNRHHSVEQQLCRWLLLTLDRIPSNELTVTHELIASMLGVRREGVTQAAGNLQHAGLITYHRGHITVLDRSGLEKHACECYSAVKKEQHRLLDDVSDRRQFPPASHAMSLAMNHAGDERMSN